MFGHPRSKSYERKGRTIVRKTCSTPIHRQIYPMNTSGTGQRHFRSLSEDRTMQSTTESCVSDEVQHGEYSTVMNFLPGRRKKSPVKPNGSHHLFPQKPKWTSDDGKPRHEHRGFEGRRSRKFRKLLPFQPNSPQMLYRARRKIRLTSVQRTPGQMMSRIFQAGYDKMECVGGSSTPRSSPLKTGTYSPNYSLFNSPGTPALSTISVLDEGDPFKSPLPVKKCSKRRYSGICTPTPQSSPFLSSDISSSSGSNWLHKPSSAKVYKSKRKLRIPGQFLSPKRIRRNEKGQSLRHCGKREKSELNFKSLESLPMNDDLGTWTREMDNTLSPEIPLLATPQQRKSIAEVVRPKTLTYTETESKWFPMSEEKTVLEHNKPDCYLDCDEESVIEECSSPDSDPGREREGWKIQLTRKSQDCGLFGRNRTTVNLVDEGLANLSQSQQENNHNKFINKSMQNTYSNHKGKTPKGYDGRLHSNSRSGREENVTCGYISPITADVPPTHLPSYGFPPDSSAASSCQKPNMRTDDTEKRNQRKSNIRVAQSRSMSSDPVATLSQEGQDQSVSPPLTTDYLRTKRSTKSRHIVKKKVLNTISATSCAMASIRDVHEEDEESAADKRWKQLLSDSAHIVDGISAKLRVTASSASDIPLQSEFEIDMGGSIMDESVGFYESYRK